MKTKEQIEQEYGIHIGDKFGELMVLNFPDPLLDSGSSSQTGVECICSCGKIKVLSPYRLSSGDTKSCGCGKSKSGAYVGLRSGKLEIVRLFRDDSKAGNQLMAHAKCDCGNEKDVLATSIVQGKVLSCGCEWRKIPKVGDRKGNLEVTDISIGKDKFGATKIGLVCHVCGNVLTMTTSKWNQTKLRECVSCRKKKNEERRRSHFHPKCNVGDIFERLKVLSIEHKSHRWECTCECQCEKHTILKVNDTALVKGLRRDCGCVNRHIKHGDSLTRLYRIFKGMHDRCTNSHSYYYKWYGGRGVSVCDEWKEWMTFKSWAMTNGYRDDLSIDRINPNGNYCPSNCKWSTTVEQNRNKRTTPHYAYQGKSMTIAEWERELCMPHSLLRSRIRAGWDFAEAVETPRFMARGWRERGSKGN